VIRALLANQVREFDQQGLTVLFDVLRHVLDAVANQFNVVVQHRPGGECSVLLDDGQCLSRHVHDLDP
jgi:hypothetical protein